jgi:sodium transport system permease protein
MMNWKNIRLLYGKEIQGAFRDRRALISMIVIPLIFYPLLFLGIGYFTLLGQDKSEALPSLVTITGAEKAPQLVEILRKEEKIKLVLPPENPEEALIKGIIHLLISIPEDFNPDHYSNNRINSEIIIQYDSTAPRSQLARKRITALLDSYRQEIIRGRLNQLGLDLDFIQPLPEQWIDLAAEEKKVGSLLGMILPYILIILIFIGAMHSAIDITAGEKERGTLATLLVSQLSRLDIVMGKYLTVMTISATSMILGLIGLGIAFLTPAYTLGELSLIKAPFSLTLFFLFFLVLAPLVGLASALLILIGIFARNSREASTYVTPIYMVAIFLGMISLSQGIELADPLFFIPILNNSFTFKELLMGTVNGTHILFTLISNIAIALLALLAATHLFKKENVLFRT